MAPLLARSACLHDLSSVTQTRARSVNEPWRVLKVCLDCAMTRRICFIPEAPDLAWTWPAIGWQLGCGLRASLQRSVLELFLAAVSLARRSPSAFFPTPDRPWTMAWTRSLTSHNQPRTLPEMSDAPWLPWLHWLLPPSRLHHEACSQPLPNSKVIISNTARCYRLY